MREQGKPGTFDLYEKLPPLPVPSLDETCERYLRSVAPLVDETTLGDVAAALDELKAPAGVGEALQKALEERARTRDNWLAGWWEDAAYLGWPTPLPINSSIAISADARQSTGDQAARAAEVTAGALAFHLAIVNETFPPEVARNGAPFDMSLLKRFYATTRLPGLSKDRIETFSTHESRHIVVLRGRRLFTFDVLDDNLAPLSAGELLTQFRRVIAAADVYGIAPPPVAALTAVDRPAWARLRETLKADPANRTTLDIVERALFHVALDREDYPGFTSLGRAGLHGKPGNRWFDKSLTLIIDRDGRLVLHGEHSPVDAGAWCPLLDMIAEPSGSVIAPSAAELPHPKMLDWQLTDDLRAAVDGAAAAHKAAIEDLDLDVVEFADFGKELIKTFQMGPDPFLQMAFQLAYWRLHGRVPKTYESASTRSFRQGRTETIRVASPESKAFVVAFDNPALPAATKQERARAAFSEHSVRGRDASAGMGVDRHLLGLALIAKDIGVVELPRLLSLPIHTLGWEVTSAQVPLATAFVNHFGPVMPDGYGIAYVIKPESFALSISSFKSSDVTRNKAFVEAVEKALRDLRRLLEAR